MKPALSYQESKRSVVNPHDGDIISGGLSRLRLMAPHTNPNVSPRPFPRPLDVVYDIGKKD